MTLLSKPLFKKIHKLYGPPPTWSRPEGFVSLSMFILEQQVSLASAKAHFEKLNSYVKKFSPKEILKLSDQEMRACQISRQKTKYLRALSEAILKKEIVLEKLRELPEEEARAQLIKIKGIGNWTADVYLMFALQSKDIFPIGDIALVNTVRELTKADTKEEIIELAETWRPNRTLASFYLWHYYLSKRGRS
ncbi:MAG: DNA-3-methyladenine glycosylase 2 family protein [Bacteroidetes bacterium]|nr:DNA-3-methyladenine glycosylase 2 family protein [Bacteroidota bacterium]